jgi:membrane dipeptidase
MRLVASLGWAEVRDLCPISAFDSDDESALEHAIRSRLTRLCGYTVAHEVAMSTVNDLVLIDGHEDLSMGTLADGRDYLSSAKAIRAAEAAAGFANPNGVCMLGLADWLAARVAVIVASVQTIPRSLANPGELSYATIEGAHQQALAHLDVYRRWEVICPQIQLIGDRRELEAVAHSWSEGRGSDPAARVGLVPLMENADPIREPGEVAFWAEQGIRLIGPAWHANRFSGNTTEGGPLTSLGRELLKEMGHLGLTLDLTHISEEAALEALETYAGGVVATHAHSQRSVPSPRLLSDRVIEGIVARGGVVGVLPLNWALDASWQPSHGKRAVKLAAVVDAIDLVCQIAGDARHVGLGTDFDGGQGSEATPEELDTVADLPKLASALAARGFAHADIAAVMGRNWLEFLRRQLP